MVKNVVIFLNIWKIIFNFAFRDNYKPQFTLQVDVVHHQ